MRYKINEIFNSIQGEGSHAGRNATFIRFSGCNLACSFCDTEHQRGELMDVEQIVNQCEKFASRFAVFTGGEPTLWNLNPLIQKLHDREFCVAMETNGTRPVPPTVDWVTCSPKVGLCDGAVIGIDRVDELKVLYKGESFDEGAYAQIDAKEHYLQPLDTGDEAANRRIVNSLLNYICEHPQWKLSMQLHKLIGVR